MARKNVSVDYVQTKVIEILADGLRLEKNRINSENYIQKDLSADSLDVINTLMLIEEWIEKEHGVTLDLTQDGKLGKQDITVQP